MDRQTWWVVLLLLPLCLNAGTKETVVKTVGRDPGLVPVCMNQNGSGLIVFVTCTVLTDKHRGEECRLLLLRDKKFQQKCDDRFTLILKDPSVFIELTGLTAEDSGAYTCECSYERGTHVTSLNITVEGVMNVSSSVTIATIVAVSLCAATCVIAAGIFCCDILRKNRHRDSREHITSDSPEANEPLEYSNQDDVYENLQRPSSDIYQNIPYNGASADPIHIYDTVNEETDDKESPIYESF